jgi:hypothetical protein
VDAAGQLVPTRKGDITAIAIALVKKRKRPAGQPGFHLLVPITITVFIEEFGNFDDRIAGVAEVDRQ